MLVLDNKPHPGDNIIGGQYHRNSDLVWFKVTPDLRGCPPGRNSYLRHFKGKHGKLYIDGKLNKWRFW